MSKQPVSNDYAEKLSEMLQLVEVTHNKLEENEKKREEAKKKRLEQEGQEEEKEDSTEVQNSMSRGQILEALARISETEDKKSKKIDEQFKVPSLRFAYIEKNKYEDGETQKELADALKKIKELKLNIEVQLVENIDIKAGSPDKFYIKITDENGNFVTMDLLKYQENIYDYTVDEEESIKNVLVRLKGVYSQEAVDASKAIANYISLALGYKETFHREYKVVGWSKLDGNTIFKYDKIYSNYKPEYKGFCGEDWAEAIKVSKNDEESKRLWNTFMAHTFNRSTVADIILCAAVSGIVRQNIIFSKENNINMNIVAEKGSGKSTMQHLILSFFGNPDKLEGSFIDTENASDQIRVERAIIPYVLDERMLKVESNGEKKKATEMLLSIFREYEGKIKSRLGSQYNNSNASAYGAIISSSVESLLDLIQKEYAGRDLGQYRRFIELKASKGDLFADGEHAKAADNIAYSKYGYGVPQIINYIIRLFAYSDFVELINKISKKDIPVADMLFFIDCNMKGDLTEDDKDVLFSRLNNSLDNNTIKENVVGVIAGYEAWKHNNRTDILDILYNFTVKEITDKLKEFEDGEYIGEMDSSAQRFALLVLTGYLLNHSFNCAKSEIKFDMDIDNMVDYLIKNLFVKLDNADVIVDKQEIIEIEEQEKRKEQKKQAEEQAYRDLLFKLCDWLKDNKDYFYIPHINNRNKGELIGRYKENVGKGTLEITIPEGTEQTIRYISWNTILNNLDESGAEFLDYQYRGKKIPNIIERYTLEKLIDINSEIIILPQKGTDKPQIPALGLRGDIIQINIGLLERLRGELQSQEESEDETN